jgi:hypothetical protein
MLAQARIQVDRLAGLESSGQLVDQLGQAGVVRLCRFSQ